MLFYPIKIRLAALLGNKKAAQWLDAQAATLRNIREKNLKNAIWIHIASAEQAEQISPIINRIKTDTPNQKILLTICLCSGYKPNLQFCKADQIEVLPFPTKHNAAEFIQDLNPKMVISLDHRIGTNYLQQLKKAKIPTYLMSLRLNKRSRYPEVSTLRLFTHIGVQDTASREWLLRNGLEQVTIVGDTRFDQAVSLAKQAPSVPQLEFFRSYQHTLIIASNTVLSDERLLARYIETHKDISLVLIPQDAGHDHLQQIFQLFEGRILLFSQATQLGLQAARVLVVDKDNITPFAFQYGKAAYIGGGLQQSDKNGLIEAATWRLPIVVNADYKHCTEAEGAVAAGAAKAVKKYTQFENAMNKALEDNSLGSLSYNYIQTELGAIDKICRIIENKNN